MTTHQRLRAVLVCAANPLRSYAATNAWEESFRHLDLLVVTEIAMSETAALAHYVLPARSAYESRDAAPGGIVLTVYGRMRRPVIKPDGEQKEAGEIFTLLADATGLIPELPESLYLAAKSGNLREYRDRLIEYLQGSPSAAKVLHFIAAKTLGNALGSAHLASFFTTFLQMSQERQRGAERAGFPLGPYQGLQIFQAILNHPEGILIGIRGPEKNLHRLATRNGKIQLYVSEVEDWIKEIDPEKEAERLRLPEKFPFILMAGRHMDMNANTGMRDPSWNRGRRFCTLAINPADAEKLGVSDGQMVRVIPEVGEETIEAEVTEAARKGQVIIPHGFGLVYNGVKYGANVNRLTKATHRDQFGTPIHRYVPCCIEPL